MSVQAYIDSITDAFLIALYGMQCEDYILLAVRGTLYNQQSNSVSNSVCWTKNHCSCCFNGKFVNYEHLKILLYLHEALLTCDVST